MSEIHPAVLMFVAHRHVERRVMDLLASSGFDDITLAQARVAARVSAEGVRLTELAEQSQVTKQSAGFLVDQLARAGYVERVPDPRDARARLVRLAPRGQAAQDAARAVEREVAQEWEQHLGPARMRALRSALADLRTLTDPWA